MGDSRSALLAAAAEEFARHGLHGARVQAIVQRAGVNERMLYHHFDSKEGLYRAVLAAERSRFGEDWGPALERAAAMAPYDGMRLALAAFFDLMSARPQLVAILMHEWLGNADTNSMPSAGSLPAVLRELYERGQRDGVFSADPSFELAYAATIGSLVGMVIFLPRFAESNNLPADPAVLRERAVTQLLEGLTGAPSAPPAPPG